MFPTLKVETSTKWAENPGSQTSRLTASTFPLTFMSSRVSGVPTWGGLWVEEEETPPPLDISRRFRTENRVETCLERRGRHPRNAVCAQNESNTKAQRCGFVIKLSFVCISQVHGAYRWHRPPYNNTHTLSLSKNGWRGRGEGGRAARCMQSQT